MPQGGVELGERLIEARRLQGAKVIATIALLALAVSTPFVFGIAALLDTGLGVALGLFVLALAAYQGAVLLLLKRGLYRPWVDWLSTAVEISAPTVIAIIDARQVGPAYALTSAPMMFFGVAVVVSALRLRPRIVLFAGVLGAVELATLSVVLRAMIPADFIEQLPSLSLSNCLQKSAYVFVAGLAGFFLSRAMLQLARDTATALDARRASEAQLQQVQKMEAIGLLAGGIAHDFNNLLTGILGYARSLAEGHDPEDPVAQDADEICQAVERAVGLTRQLLTFSRKEVTAPRLLELDSHIGATKRLLARIIGEDVQVSFIPGAPGGTVFIDPTHLEQVLMNLVVNARDAMPGGGVVTIETGCHDGGPPPGELHGSLPAGPALTVAVRDTGVGLSPEARAHLFEPFFTTKARGKGTGLGLSTVHGILQQANGAIAVDSTVGQGTSFQIYLPRGGAMEEVGPEVRTEVLQRKARILLVEDEPMVRRIVQRSLQRAGYSVVSAAGCDQAQLLFKDRAPDREFDLLLTDVIMPDDSGVTLWERLSAEAPRLRVLFMSGYTDDRLGHYGMLAPDTPLIRKPFTDEALLARLKEALERPRPAP